jgi:hypothetical protein
MISGNLFTRDYLLEGIVPTEQWKVLTDEKFQALKERIAALAKEFGKHKSPNEAVTEKDFIYPVLEVLGWKDILVQPNLSAKGRKQVPDALLLADSEAKAKAASEGKEWKGFKHGLAILEAKRWRRSLDTGAKGEEGAPDAQMLQYLSRADIQTSGKLRLGILTNGEKWRLYFQGALSVADDFFEIDLAKAIDWPGHDLDIFDAADKRMTRDHALRLFVLMFSRTAFLPVEGPLTFHDLSRETGRVWEEKVTTDLSHLVFDELFPRLVTAIAANDKNRPTDVGKDYLDQVRQSALVLLYRLLFVVYAEDRDLLPDNKQPYKDFSLTTMRLEIAMRKADGKAESSTHVSFWPRLTAIFKAIADGNNDFGIPPYNGGLFASETAPLLVDVQLPDSIVTDLIYGLSHRIENGEPRYINYRDLSVQQLGSVYERTLEYGLKVDDGDVVVDADDTARHESGSYYTPDSLVMLIIEKAVGPFVKDALDKFKEQAEALAKDKRAENIRLGELRRIDPARVILSLKICDPAMGSGHFLVNLVDWLADKVLSSMSEAVNTVEWANYESPLAHDITKIRDEIIDHAHKNNWPYVAEHLQDRHIVRRMVLKRCVYGVDKNPLAVELAKVSLWLHTFTVGAPLSFLDHHLRCGDSLFGAWVRPAMDRLVEWGSPLLMDAPLKRAFGAAAGMQTIEKLTDADIAEVYQSKNLFEGIESMTSDLTGLLNLVHATEWQSPKSKLDLATVQAWTKGTFGDPVKLATGDLQLKVPAAPTETEMERKKREITGGKKFNGHETAATLAKWLPELKARMATGHFLHWQVAFPGIWHTWESVDLHGGFDAVIGNPPYVRQELIKALKPGLKRAYPDTYDGAADLYVYFYDQGMRLLKPGGRLSFVVTNKWMRVGYAEGLRNQFATKAWIEFVADFGHAKKFFPDADVFPSVLVVRKPNGPSSPSETLVCAIARDDIPEKGLAEAVAKRTHALPSSRFTRDTWLVDTPEAVKLFDKLSAAGTPLKRAVGVDPLYGIKTAYNDAYIIDDATRQKLVQEDPSCRGLIRSYLRGQDIIRWSCPDTNLHMIVMKSSNDFAWPWANASDEAEAERIFASTYPSLHRHFKRYESITDPATGTTSGLRHREDQGRFWWELRSCSYYGAFERPKTLYVDITWQPSFLVDARGRFTSNTCYFLPTNAPAVVASLNSPIGWWYSWRKAQHGKDEALRYFTSFIESYPVAPLQGEVAAEAGLHIEELARLTEACQSTDGLVADWIRITFQPKKLKPLLLTSSRLSTDEFAAAIRDTLPKRQKLTMRDLEQIREQYGDVIEPARQFRAQIFDRERGLSDLVNQAYGLTPEEVDLMWRTAPPRMPFTPAGLATDADQSGMGADNEDDEE